MAALWDFEVIDDPRFIVGYRKASGKIDCYRIDIHRDIFGDFREVAESAQDHLRQSEPRDYAPFGALEENEYFFIAANQIPVRETSGDRTTRQKPGVHEMAEALRIVNETDQHPVLSSNDLRSDTRFNLYVLSFRVEGGYLGFIRKLNPRKSFKPGLRYFQYGDTLKKVDQPDFVIDDLVDVVISPTEVAILTESVVPILFRDVQLAMQSVNANVTTVVTEFAGCLPISPAGVDALRRNCSRGPRNAKRLYDLIHYRLAGITLNSQSIGAALSARNLGHLLVNDELHLSDTSVSDFFDFIEGRLFDDDHTPEARRADRFSARK